jgi:hypothetical protein
MVADRFSIALTISVSDLAEVEQTETQAEVSFGALIVTADVAFFDVFADVIFLFSMSRHLGT